MKASIYMDEKLKKDIKIELDNLRRLIIEMRALRERISEELDFVVTRSAGSILHDFYSAIFLEIYTVLS